MITLLNNVINSFEQIVLEVVDIENDMFKLVAGNCDWGNALFPFAHQGEAFLISDDLPFLQDFLIDAKLIWSYNDNSRIKSGFWTETLTNNIDLHLEAVAIKQDNNNLLVISNQSEEFHLRQNTMQSARELVLFNDNALEKNEYFQVRLLSLLKNPTEVISRSTLLEIIEKAGFAVLIVNPDFVATISNTAADLLFQQPKSSNQEHESPLTIIDKLLKNQLPEFERIRATKSSWEGELCWMAPPATLKWLKVSLFPVKDKYNDVINWIIFANDISKVKYLIQRNEQLSFQDMLTELPNRLSFWQSLEQQIQYNKPFYLLYIDINEFRRHNEFFGHDEGDKLLVELGSRIKSVIKNTDIIGRVGGDEFAIILTKVKNQDECEKVVQRILNSTQMPFVTSKSFSFNISLSMGAANFPSDALTSDELMKFADLCTYNGKGNIKNSLQFYSQTIKDASHHLITMEHDLKFAIKNNEFELFLQPIVNIDNDKIIKAEALIRWHHPVKGMVSPQEFIPVAEKSELIITIGKWVITRSCQLVQKLSLMGHQIKISMNLSPVQILDDNLYSYIYSCIKEYDISPNLLELEVTEGILVDDYTKVENLLNKVRALGLSVSVDDFGTGYSSLSHLKRLPLDFLKIDRTFVQDIVNDDNDKAIVKAVIAMAHNLNLGVIAEGVETKDQLKFLNENFCDSVQGYLFSKPIEFKSFIELLNAQEN